MRYTEDMGKLSHSKSGILSDTAARLGVPRQRLAVAVKAAEHMNREEFALLEELLLLNAVEAKRRRTVVEGLRDFLQQFRTTWSTSDPLSDVDRGVDEKSTISAVLWADSEAGSHRDRLLHESVSAEEAGRLTGRSRQAIERQRRAGRVIALRVGRRWSYPAWQFDADAPGGLVPGLDEVLEYLRMSPTGVAVWLTSPQPQLGDQQPIQLLRNRRTDEVLDLAKQLGYLP